MDTRTSYEELEKEVARLKQVEEALLESEKKINVIANNTLDSIFIKYKYDLVPAVDVQQLSVAGIQDSEKQRGKHVHVIVLGNVVVGQCHRTHGIDLTVFSD